MNRQKAACLGLVLSIFVAATAVWLSVKPATAQSTQPSFRNFGLDPRIVADPRFAPPATETTSALAPETPTAVWSQGNGPDTGNPFDLIRRGQRLFAGTFGGLFISDDNGENWAYQTGNGLPNGRGVTALAANETTMFLGMNFNGTGGGIYRSTNNGQTWTAANNGFPAPRSIGDMIVNGPNIFAAASAGELYRSTDNGDNWVRLSNGLPSVIATFLGGSLAISNGAVLLINQATNPSVLFRSTDNGTNWTPVTVATPAPSYVLLTSNSSKAFLGTTTGLLSSTDGGQTWQPVSGLPPAGTGFGYYAYADGATVYALMLGGAFGLGSFSTESTLFLSTDNGATWTQKLKLPFSTEYSVLAEGATLFVGHPAGIIRVDGSGASFAVKNRGLRAATTFSDIVVLGNRTFISSHGGGVWVTTDNGATWRQLKNGLPFGAFVSALAADGNTLYACLEQVLGFYRSTDFGETWTKLSDVISANNISDYPETLSINGGKIYLGMAMSGVQVSADNGATFQPLRNGIPANADVTSFTFKDSTIIVTTLGQGVFRSTDGGATFAASNTGVTTQFSYVAQYRGNTIFLAANNGLYRSPDNGATWALTTATVATYFAIAQTSTTLYASGLAGCLVSRDDGATWQTNNNGLFGRLIQMATRGNQVILATSGNSVFFQNEDAFANVSAASFNPDALAEKTIVAAFGSALATGTASASALPLPTTLNGTSVSVRDANGVERAAPLFFVSAAQVNYQLPAGTANGPATITISNGANVAQTATLLVRAAAHALFAANASGTGAAAALDAIKFTPGPFDAKQANGQPNIIAIFGTGLGGDATDVSADVSASVTARLNGNIVTTLYAGTVPGLAGLNQFNIQLPATITAGTYTLTVTRGLTSNSVTIAIK
ncbi:MAG: hypothetical protein HYR56_04300 [Acidobacteria bacterium]|nr:hypothetical protein [Acidobacteriota bacterium]